MFLIEFYRAKRFLWGVQWAGAPGKKQSSQEQV